jgi:serine/threonine protein kinase
VAGGVVTVRERDGEEEPEVAPREVIADRYVVDRVLGEGSSGRTLLCRDRVENRLVAVKELRFGRLDGWKQLELFEREAGILARLDHPAIPRVFDFVRTPGAPAVHIVQEFIDGPSLKERIEGNPMLGQGEVAELAHQMLEVLEYLHGRAPPVLHRDIKPSNVLLRAGGGAALVDFGGVLLGWRPPGSEGETVVGTFGYMPPEQLLGQAGPASDLYALGATLLHALTGRAPTDFPFDSGRIEVPRDLPSGGLVTLIEALLRPAPRDRPPTAGAALKLLAGSVPVPAVDSGRGPAIAPTETPKRVVTVVSEHGPRFVEMGLPPRDPKGEFRDVYRNLISPLFPSKRLWSGGMHAFWVTLATVGSVTTVGLLPLIHLRSIRARRKAFGDLFERGEATRGVIRSAQAGPMYATFKYEFDVDGTGYVASMEYAMEMAEFWGKGDQVPVLFDPDDPRRSCFVYR